MYENITPEDAFRELQGALINRNSPITSRPGPSLNAFHAITMINVPSNYPEEIRHSLRVLIAKCNSYAGREMYRLAGE